MIMKKMLSILLALVLCLGSTVPAFAANGEITSDEEAVLIDNVTAGYAQDVPVESNAARASSGSKKALFTLDADNATGLRTSMSYNSAIPSDTFYRGDLTKGCLLIKGTLSYTKKGSYIKVGAATYSKGTFTAAKSYSFASGKAQYVNIDKTAFKKNVEYYGFLKNTEGGSGNYVKGSIVFYNATSDAT